MKPLFKIQPVRFAALLGAWVILAGMTSAQGETGRAATPFSLDLPMYFEANHGQAPAGFQYLSRGLQQNVLIAPTEMIVSLTRAEKPVIQPGDEKKMLDKAGVQTRSVQLKFVGGNGNAILSGAEELSARINYLIGNDPARWHAGVPAYKQVQVDGLYPGIDLLYYANERQLEYDFTVAPGADPAAIVIHFAGADGIRVDDQGGLVVKLGGGEIRQPRPVIYQTVAGARREIAGGYRLKDPETVTFALGAYDHQLPLVIDPILNYSTFFGGAGSDIAWAVAVDTNGFVYLAGETLSPVITNTPGAFQTNYQGGGLNGDAFVAKFTPDGTNLVFFTYVGGGADDTAFGMKVSSSGFIYLTGSTTSPDFPHLNFITHQTSGTTSYSAINSPFDPTFNGHRPDAFVTVLTSGGGYVYSLFLGGSSDDVGIGLGLDAANNVYVTGYTYSTNYPVSANGYDINLPYQTNLLGSNDVFVTKISADGLSVPYSTYLGGSSFDEGEAIAADAGGNAYVAGYSYSTNFPATVGALTNVYAAPRTLNNASNTLPDGVLDDAFVAKFSTTNTSLNGRQSLLYCTLLGGSNGDAAFAITLDASNNAFVAGYTRSFDFPVTSNSVASTVLTNGNIALNGPISDAFLARISPDGGNLSYATVFGGSSFDTAYSVAVDPLGDVFVTGRTLSPDFPTNNANGFLQNFNSGSYDVFVTALDPTLTNVLYSVYLGGAGDEFGYSIVADAAGSAYVAGVTTSLNFPATNAIQGVFMGGSDAFLAKISLPVPLSLSIVPDNTNFDLTWPAGLSEYSKFVLQQNTSLQSPSNWVTVTNAVILTNGVNLVSLGATNNVLFFRLKH